MSSRFVLSCLAASVVLAPAAGIARPLRPDPTPAGARQPGSDLDVHARADALDARIDAAVAAHRLSRAEAGRLHRAVGRIHTLAGHEQRVNGGITPDERAGFDRALARIGQRLPRP